MIWKGMAMSWRMGGALSPVLQISQGPVYAVIPLSPSTCWSTFWSGS